MKVNLVIAIALLYKGKGFPNVGCMCQEIFVTCSLSLARKGETCSRGPEDIHVISVLVGHDLLPVPDWDTLYVFISGRTRGTAMSWAPARREAWWGGLRN